MAKLIYGANTSLDLYIEDASGSFGWSTPDETVHSFINELQRPIGTYLYGRRLHEVMTAWETLPLAGESAAMVDYAMLWRAADKIVYSSTLDTVTTARTTLERRFDAGAVRAIKERSSSDLLVGGAELAGEAARAGLIDEVQLVLSPVLVGAGKSFLPGGIHLDLELVDQRTISLGTAYLRYRVINDPGK